jgi:putative heme iron utilization protein
MNPGDAARRHLRRHRYGTLSTLSKKLGGYPFGSVVGCATDHAACPVILISRLAEHTQNIEADPRVSLIVRDAGADAQAGARLTLIGNARCVGNDLAAVRARYIAGVPGAERLVALGDFTFYRIEPVTLRYIAGFGEIRWISAGDYAPPANTMAECEADIVAHMNTDHAAALREYCRNLGRPNPACVAMTAIDCDGFDVLADGELLRFDFREPAVSADGARAGLKAMLAEARA